MKNRNLIFATMLLGILFLAAFTSTNNRENKVDEKATTTGQELYRLNCAGCHGVDRKGNPPTYPSLDEIEEKLTATEVRTQIKNGKGFMPPMAHLSDEEIDVITLYLFDENGNEQISSITIYTPEKQGEMLFKSNCAGCHRATINDPTPQNANTQMCSMMEPAVLAGATKRFTKNEFLNILETGPCYMPSFSHMKQEEKETLFAHLKTLEGKEEPGQPSIGKKCWKMRKGKSCCGR